MSNSANRSCLLVEHPGIKLSRMSEGRIPPPETITGKQALEFFNEYIKSWKMDDHTTEENTFFVLNIAHWALEVFGQYSTSSNSYIVDSKYGYGEGFSYEELPEFLKGYALTEVYGNIYFSNVNQVKVRTGARVTESDPYIPKWDELSKIPVFTDMVEAARADPEVMAMLIPGEFIVAPIVEVKYSPGIDYKWGLQYILSKGGVDVLPYGEYGKTESAFEAAIAQNADLETTLKTVLKLITVFINDAGWLPEVETYMLDVLESRMIGASGIDISRVEVTPSPRNAKKNLLLNMLMQPEAND